MKRRFACYLIYMLIAAAALSGCGNNAASDNKSKQDDKIKEKTTLTYWTFQEIHRIFWDDAVAEWNKTNPDRQISLQTEVYPYDECHNRLLITLHSGSGSPDMADIEFGKFPNFVKDKTNLLPLNDIVEPVKDKLVAGRIDNYEKNGSYYGVDYHVGAEVMYYNKEILKAANVNVDDIKTWEDYLAAGKKVLTATGKPMATIESTEHWSFYPLINMQDSDMFDRNGKVILDNEINVKTLQMLKDGYTRKVFAIAPGGYHHSEEYWAWMNKGNAASIWMPVWYMVRFTQYMPGLKGKIIVRPMPVFKNGKKTAGEGGTATVITNQSKNQELSKALITASKLSKEGSIKTWSILGFDPIRTDVWDDPAMKASNEYTEYFGTDILDTLKLISVDVDRLNLNENYPAALNLLQKNVIFKTLRMEGVTPEMALKEAAEELRKKK